LRKVSLRAHNEHSVGPGSVTAHKCVGTGRLLEYGSAGVQVSLAVGGQRKPSCRPVEQTGPQVTLEISGFASLIEGADIEALYSDGNRSPGSR
jgi:hypothetical protein